MLRRHHQVACSPSPPSKPKNRGSLTKLLSWFSFKERNQTDHQKTPKKRALHNLIVKLVRKGKKKKRPRPLNSSNVKFLCVPSLYLYERCSRTLSSIKHNPSFISRRTASDANVSYKCSYENTTQKNCFIPLKDKIGCYYSVVVNGKQYSLSDLFVKATKDSDSHSHSRKREKLKSIPQKYQFIESVVAGIKKEVQSDGVHSESHPKKTEFEMNRIFSKCARNKFKKSCGGGDGINNKGNRDVTATFRPDIHPFSKGKSPTFQNVSKKPKQTSRNDSWNTIESGVDEDSNVLERVIVQSVISNGVFRERSSSPGKQSSCCVLKKNSVHKTNLARLGTNLETARLKKLQTFIRTHRIDSGKLEFKDRLALQWVESKGGGKMPSALETEKKASAFQDLSTRNAFFEPASVPVRIEPQVSRFVPHFPQNKKFVYEVKPPPVPNSYYSSELRERYEQPPIVSSFSQESIPSNSLFVPHSESLKPDQESVKMMSNLWNLGKHTQKEDRNVERRRVKQEPNSWNFKMPK